MSLKDSFMKLKDSILIWFLAVIVAAFIAGFGAYEAIVRLSGREVVNPETLIKKTVYEELGRAYEELNNKFKALSANHDELMARNVAQSQVDISWAVQNAKKKGKKYAILNIVQHIELEDMTLNNKPIRRARMRNTYTIYAIADIVQDSSVFIEAFTTDQKNVTLTRWAGSEEQNDFGGMKGWYTVNFSAKSNSIKTIVTGADYYYEKPMLPHGEVCSGKVDVAKDEWVWCYPNGDDFIDRLTMIVEAANFNVLPADNSMIRSASKTQLNFDKSSCMQNATTDKCTIVAAWDKIYQGECVSLKHKWSL
jgi:hypothetical protein